VAALLAVLLASPPAAAAEKKPEPPKLPVVETPLVQTPSDSGDYLAKAKAANKGYAVDLTTGEKGGVLEVAPDQDLEPGRYRVHLLLATAPHESIIVDPVEVRVHVPEWRGHFKRDQFPEPGMLSAVGLNFLMKEKGKPRVLIDWILNETCLDKNNPDKGDAWRKFKAQRAAEALSARESGATDAGRAADIDLTGGDDDDGPGLDEEADGPLGLDDDAYRPGKKMDLSHKTLPKYRLVVAGLHFEALCPVRVQEVLPSKVASGKGEETEVRVKLQNCSESDACVSLELAIQDACAKPTDESKPLATEAATIPAGESLEHEFEGTFSTEGVDWLGSIQIKATWKDRRPSENTGLFVIAPPKKPVIERKRKAFAHYMGCWPAGSGPILWERRNLKLNHHNKDDAAKFGGHVRNYDLVPPDLALTTEESADLEIRRAMRIGLDGFAVDAWAGDKDARRTLDALFKVAEEKGYPFEITVCIDPACGGSIVGTVKEVLAKHGDSPKLARRDGRPLVFGYMSVWPGFGHLLGKLPSKGQQLRSQPIGWHVMGRAFEDARRQIGRSIYYHYCMSAFFHNAHGERPGNALVQAARILANYVDAIGGFTYLGKQEPEIAKAVIAAGAEWSDAIGMYQKENIPYECWMPPGTEWVHGNWHSLSALNATLVQFITWNDYGENSNLAPAYNTRYTIYDLTGYHIQRWKTGKAPELDDDRIYLTYAKYPRDAKVWPFKVKWTKKRKLEVCTILTKPGTIRLPGREVEYDAPAGLHSQQFPLKPGPVIAELLREGKALKRIESPEPITDRPFRMDNAMVCYSTEFERHWKADFGDREPWHYSEYGDLDNDGLPNWFEMYWFTKARGFEPSRKATMEEEIAEEKVEPVYTKWLDFSTATRIDPKADPDGDGKTNLQEYLDRTDPTTGALPDKAPADLEGMEEL